MVFHSPLWMSHISLNIRTTSSLSIHRWTVRLRPCLDYWEWYCNEHRGACIFLNYDFVWICAREWDCRIIYRHPILRHVTGSSLELRCTGSKHRSLQSPRLSACLLCGIVLATDDWEETCGQWMNRVFKSLRGVQTVPIPISFLDILSLDHCETAHRGPPLHDW